MFLSNFQFLSNLSLEEFQELETLIDRYYDNKLILKDMKLEEFCNLSKLYPNASIYEILHYYLNSDTEAV